MKLLAYSLVLLCIASCIKNSPLSSGDQPESLSSNSTEHEKNSTSFITTQVPSNNSAEEKKSTNTPEAIQGKHNNCSSNSSTDELLLKAAIAKEILNRLGMEDVPKMDVEMVSEETKKEITELYERSMKEIQKITSNGILFNEEQFFVSQFNSFVDNGTRPNHVRALLSEHPALKNQKRVYFEVNTHEMAVQADAITVKSATLKLYKARVKPELVESTDLIDRSLLIEINQLVVGNSGDYNSSTSLLRKNVISRRVSLEAPGWENFDVSKAVLVWMKDPSSILGLEIVCDERYAMDSVVSFVAWQEGVLQGWDADADDVTHKYPLLNVITQKIGQEKKSKRSVDEIVPGNDLIKEPEVLTGPDDCEQGDGEERCCRFPLYISFAEIGWDSWVFKPEGYQAYYCSGNCPKGYKSANKYALMLSYLSEKRQNNLQLKCVASEFKPLNIAHLNQRKIPIVSILPNMVPQRCHCL